MYIKLNKSPRIGQYKQNRTYDFTSMDGFGFLACMLQQRCHDDALSFNPLCSSSTCESKFELNVGSETLFWFSTKCYNWNSKWTGRRKEIFTRELDLSVKSIYFHKELTTTASNGDISQELITRSSTLQARIRMRFKPNSDSRASERHVILKETW